MEQATCSVDGCASAALVRGWCNLHYQRWYRTGSVDPKPAPQHCKACSGAISETNSPGPAPLYCSKLCQHQESYRRRKAAGAIKRPARTPDRECVCVKCGAGFSARRSRRFCARACEQRWLNEDNPNRCTVPDCDRGERAKGLCNMHWRRKARAEGRELPDPWNERRRANHAKRKALKRGAESAVAFSNLSIYERDEWTCGICDGPVDRLLEWPDPMSVSLDHVVPLSKGGSHAPDNAQCAHLVCNVRKGARTDAQLLEVS